ncbi:hypothetical protein [Paraburkholderia atlantica]|uniref:hypothetical protein n=1 Tax=Paraburkholderia atlantica TaxID=2654982 RepID=UPI003D1CA8DC
MEQLKQQSSGTDCTVEEECDLCRITYSIYSKFPPMPHAQALNAETGEFFPFDRVRKMKSGYAMAEALGYAWACNCRGRAQKRFNEQFTLRDGNAQPLANVRYRVRTGSTVLASGVTDSNGRTHRIMTNGSQALRLEVAH